MRHAKWVLVLTLIGMVFLWSVPVHAVLKDILVTGSGGGPVPNTEITIFDKEGKEIGKEETNDKGMLVYDFPGKGKYNLKWPGGSQVVDITGVWTQGKIAAATAAVVGVGVLIAGSSGSGCGGGGGGGTNGDEGSVPSIGEIAGTYSLYAIMNSQTGPCDGIYPKTITNPLVQISTNGVVTVHSKVNVEGSYNSDGSFNGTGTTDSIRETIIGKWEKNGAIQLICDLIFEHFAGKIPGCRAVYDAIYTKN